MLIAGVQSSAKSADLSSADKQFMTMAAEANMTEAHLGEMAESQRATRVFKAFAQTLVQDHTKAYRELLNLSDKTGEKIPRESMSPRMQASSS